MNIQQAKTLKVGDKVETMELDAPVSGEVNEVGYAAVRIFWQDGVVSLMRHDDLKNVYKVPSKREAEEADAAEWREACEDMKRREGAWEDAGCPR
jgi:hypothetical protein